MDSNATPVRHSDVCLLRRRRKQFGSYAASMSIASQSSVGFSSREGAIMHLLHNKALFLTLNMIDTPSDRRLQALAQ